MHQRRDRRRLRGFFAATGRQQDGNGNNGNNGDLRGTPRSTASRMPVDEDRVKPVRIGGNNRPLYPRGEDISAERVRGSGSPVARREAGASGSNRGSNAPAECVTRWSASRLPHVRLRRP